MSLVNLIDHYLGRHCLTAVEELLEGCKQHPLERTNNRDLRGYNVNLALFELHTKSVIMTTLTSVVSDPNYHGPIPLIKFGAVTNTLKKVKYRRNATMVVRIQATFQNVHPHFIHSPFCLPHETPHPKLYDLYHPLTERHMTCMKHLYKLLTLTS